MGWFSLITKGAKLVTKTVAKAVTFLGTPDPKLLKQGISFAPFDAFIGGGIAKVPKVVAKASGFVSRKVLPTIARYITRVSPSIIKALPKTPTGVIKTVAVGGVVAGGGLAVLPKIYTASKVATKEALPVLLGEEKFTKEKAGSVAKVVGTALGIGAVGYGVAKVIEKATTKETVAKAVGVAKKVILPATAGKVLAKEKEIKTDTTLPAVRETTTLTKKRRKKRKVKKVQPQRISQKVNLYINNNQNLLKVQGVSSKYGR